MTGLTTLLALAWAVHTWSGYQPLPTVTDETVDGRAAKRVANVQGSSGGCIMTEPRTPCRAGDVVRVSFEAKGRGAASATVARYSVSGGYNQTCARQTFALGADWQHHAFDFQVADGTDGETGSCDFQLVVDKGGEAFFANVEMKLERRAREDFEGAGPYVGGVEVIEGNIAPGLLSRTRLGLLHADAARRIAFPTNTFFLPTIGGNAYLESAVRLYSFGRDVRRKATLDVKFAGADGAEFALRVAHDPASDVLACTLADRQDGKTSVCGRLDVPYRALPADFVLSAALDGEVRLEVNSLADSSRRISKAASRFFKGRRDAITTHMVYTPREGAGELVFDNYSVGRADPEVAFAPVPCELEKTPTFDPVASGWPLVFADEFGGTAVDEAKWEFSPGSRKDLAIVTNGVLHVRCDWDAAREKLQTVSLWSRDAWEYGYFEARVRFTRNSGWWSAFWLCSRSPANPFKDGFEIDIFEDYYTRSKMAGGEHRPILDHNLHLFGSAVLKSWNYGSTLPGSLDDFYVIGCKWTPFEISLYLNGKLIASKAGHSRHGSVTFDAISHGAGFSPLRAIVSGQIMDKSWSCHDTTGFTFPEDYLVDYVRVYARPAEAAPAVALACDRPGLFTRMGDAMRFEVKAAPAADGANVKAVYLFDSGYLLDYRTEPPYVFDVSFTDSCYGRTRYMRAGRSGKVTPLKGTGLHVFAAYAMDEKGRYAHATETVEKLICDFQKSRPYRGEPQRIPGVVKCGLYDEGGPGVAYSDTTAENVASKTFRPDEGVDAASETCIGSVNSGEWLTYSVEVARTGDYRATFTYGTPERGHAKLQVFLDGEKVGTFDCPAHAAAHWGADTKSVVERMRLPAGRHRLTILCEERYNFSTLEFVPVEEAKSPDGK